MSTDQIQTKLYARSDKETEARVAAACAPLVEFMRSNQLHTAPIKVQASGNQYWLLDGTKVTQAMSNDDIAKALLYGKLRVSVPLQEALPAIRAQLQEACHSRDRAAYVEQFLADVERLRADVEELRERVGDVEARD